MIDGSPEIVRVAFDLHENLVQMPPPTAGIESPDQTFLDLRCEHWTEPLSPVSDGLVTHIGSALLQQIFDVPKRQWKTNVHHDGKADDLGDSFEVLEGDRLVISKGYTTARLRPNEALLTMPSDR